MRTYLLLATLLWNSLICAGMYALPKGNNDVIGQVQTTVVQRGDNFASIALKYNVTYTGLVEANPGVNPSKPAPGTELIIPSAIILPAVPRKGIVINLAELRLYYFPANEKVVYSFPIGIGVEGWSMPQGVMKIVEKQKDPTWYVPDSVHEELLRKGFNVPKQIPPGPDNPLGGYMLRLSQWTYLIHGVVDSTTVGRRSSSGCVRMYPDDIKQMFTMVPVGTPVRVINEPYKLGWNNGQLYLEAHLPLQEEQIADAGDLSPLVTDVNNFIGRKQIAINWDRAFALTKQGLGIPQEISAG